MGKNKGKGDAAKAAPVTKTPVVPEKAATEVGSKVEAPKAAPVVTKSTAPQPKPEEKKTDTKPVETKPKQDKTGKVEPTAAVEVSTKPIVGEMTPTFQANAVESYLQGVQLTPTDIIDANHLVDLVTVANQRLKGADPKSAMTIAINQTLDDLMAYSIVVAGINMAQHGKRLGLSVPIANWTAFAQMYANFGVALPEPKVDPNNPVQLLVPFGGVSEETQKGVEAEIKLHEAPIRPSMDPKLWKTEEDAQKAILYILSDTLAKYSRMEETTNKMREYKIFNAVTPEEKEMWKVATPAAIIEAMLLFLTSSSSILLNGIGGQTYSTVVAYKHPIRAHLCMKKHFMNYTDKEIAEIVKVFIKYKALHNSPDKDPLTSLGYLGLSLATRERCLVKAAKTTEEDKEDMGRLQNCYATEIGLPTEAGYSLKAVNKMVTILNEYVPADKQFACYIEKEYPEAVEAALKSTSEPAKKEEGTAIEPALTPDPANAEVPADKTPKPEGEVKK